MIGLLLQAYNLCNAWVLEDDPEYRAWRKALETYLLTQGVKITWDNALHASTLTSDYTAQLDSALACKETAHAG